VVVAPAVDVARLVVHVERSPHAPPERDSALGRWEDWPNALEPNGLPSS
jgi:hypothetical protein